MVVPVTGGAPSFKLQQTAASSASGRSGDISNSFSTGSFGSSSSTDLMMLAVVGGLIYLLINNKKRK